MQAQSAIMRAPRFALLTAVCGVWATHAQVQPVCPDCAHTVYTAGQTYTLTVPSNVTWYQVHLWGAGGAGPVGSGGAGAYVTGYLQVTPGASMALTVGSGGCSCGSTPSFGGGGAGSPAPCFNLQTGGCGGGLTTLAVQQAPGGQLVEVATAGGGGGGGNDNGSGCNGGAATWTGCAQAAAGTFPGGPGCPNAGGASTYGNPGSQYRGGDGKRYDSYNGGSGGGSGHFGGGGGGCGAGGGSSFTDGLQQPSGVSGNYATLPSTMPYYVAGIAQGGAAVNGGNGMAVLVEIPANAPFLPSPSASISPSASVAATVSSSPSTLPTSSSTQAATVSSAATSTSSPTSLPSVTPSTTSTPASTPFSSLPWAQFGGDSAHSGRQCAPNGVGPGAAQPSTLWTFNTGSCQGELPYCSSSPLAASDGTIFVASGSWVGALTRFGQVRWTATPPPVADYYATPALSEADNVFVVAGWAGSLTGYAADTGAVLWQQSSQLAPGGPVGVSMLTLDVSTSPASLFLLTAQSCIQRYNVATGARTGQSCIASDPSVSPPFAAISPQRIVAGFALASSPSPVQFIRAFNTSSEAGTLALQWSTSVQSVPNGAAQTTQSGFTYSSTLDAYFVTVTPPPNPYHPGTSLLLSFKANGTLVFSFALPAPVLAALALSCDGTTVYTLDVQGQLSARAGSTGSALWTAYLPILGSQSAPVVSADGTLYVSGSSPGNYAAAVSPAGDILWEVAPAVASAHHMDFAATNTNITTNANDPSPVLAGGGLLLVLTRDGMLTAYGTGASGVRAPGAAPGAGGAPAEPKRHVRFRAPK